VILFFEIKNIKHCSANACPNLRKADPGGLWGKDPRKQDSRKKHAGPTCVYAVGLLTGKRFTNEH
jgi:hypothetical protein